MLTEYIQAAMQEVLEESILIRTRRQLDLPIIDGFDLNPKAVEPQEAASSESNCARRIARPVSLTPTLLSSPPHVR